MIIAEAFRNKMVYEYFKDCPEKPRYKHDKAVEYCLKTTTGGPINEAKKES